MANSPYLKTIKKVIMLLNTATYITEIMQIIISTRNKAHTAINSAMIEAYWLIGELYGK